MVTITAKELEHAFLMNIFVTEEDSVGLQKILDLIKMVRVNHKLG